MNNIKVRSEGYTTISNILNKEDIEKYRLYFEYMEQFQKLKPGKKKFALSYNQYADIMCESLLLHLHSYVEKATNKSLFPTYSFHRKYLKGAELVKHYDRPSCEVSCTLTIDFDKDANPWPIYIRIEEQEVPVYLDKGEALVYYGCETEHWRKEFKGEYSIHAFLHYVDAHGPYKEYKFDKRKQIFGNSNFRNVFASRINTLRHIDKLSATTLLQKLNQIPYNVTTEGVVATLQFDNKRNIKIPVIMIPVVNLIMRQEGPFSLKQLRSDFIEKAGLLITKELLINGYLEVIESERS